MLISMLHMDIIIRIYGGKLTLSPHLTNYGTNPHRNFGILVAFIIFFMIAYLIAVEKVVFEHSKGEVLVFKRGHKMNRPEKGRADEESRGQEKGLTSSLPPDDEKPRDRILQIHQQKAVFHWNDVCWEIQIKGRRRVILDHVSGWVKPGTLTALMVCFPLQYILATL